MFYTYDLSFDRASSLTYGLALTAANGEAQAASTRKNGASLPLGAVDPQNVCGNSSNPFSSDFSIDFGGGATNYVLFTVNKLLNRTLAQVVFLLEPPTRFHLNSQAAPATSSQIAHISKRRIGAELLAVMSAGVIRLVLARPWHIIQAAKSPASIRIVKAVTKRAFHAIDTEVSTLARALGHVVGAISTQALQTLYKVAGLVHATSSASSHILLNIAGKRLSSSIGGAASVFTSFGKLLTRTMPEATSVSRAIPWRVVAASGESARLSFGGGNLFARSFGALWGESAALRRRQAVLLGLLGANVAQAGRTPGKLASVAEPEAVSATKLPGVLHGATDGQVASLKRGIGLLRGVASASTLVLQTAASHLAAAYAAVSAQVTALFTQHIFGRSLSVLLTQSSIVSISAVRTLLRTISSGSPQVLRVVRGIAKSISALTASAQSIARSAGRMVGAASAGSASLMSLVAHFFIAGIASPEAISERASHAVLKGSASPQTAAVARRRGAFLSAVSATVASIQQRLAKLLSIAEAQVMAVTSSISSALSLASAEVAAAIKGSSKRPAAASQESASLITRHGSSLGTVSSGQASALRRLTGKFLLGLLPQALGGGRGDTKSLSATSTNSALVLRPRGIAARARQGQAAANVVYYHFFVAPWAYQQTSLLPPFGGPAEPPSFGPIDPADQTIFGFDWTSRAYPNDTIMSAVVTCVPPFLPFLAGSLYINGNLVEVTVPPFPEPVLPTVYSLRCTAKFASGRISSFSIPVPVRTL